MDIRCPSCNNPVVKHFEGERVEGYCPKCKIEVFIKRRRLDSTSKK